MLQHGLLSIGCSYVGPCVQAKLGIYNGVVKEGKAECVFSSIYTLESIGNHTRIGFIVVDEFHHATAV